MNPRPAALAIFAFVASAIAAACGGQAVTNSNDKGASWVAAQSVLCPQDKPVNGSSCDSKFEGALCWYGKDPRPDCRIVVKCNGGKWNVDEPSCRPIDNKNCPKTPDSDGKPRWSCVTPIDSPDYCVYPNDIYCQCENHSKPRPDAGAWADWTCSQPVPGCPPIAPNPGTACKEGQRTCSYMSYGLTCSPYFFSCRGGVWQLDGQEDCPLK